MVAQPDRSYDSPMRARQADETRRRITDTAKHLLISKGYAGSTIEAIAERAGVAPQTVYAVFGSKRGILAEIIRTAAYGSRYRSLVRRSMASRDPEMRLVLASRIATGIHGTEQSVFELLRGAGVVAPELASLERQRETDRFHNQKSVVQVMVTSGRLRKGLTRASAQAVLWALTGRDLYRMLVVERGWSPARYQKWLAQTLIGALLISAKRAKRRPKAKPTRISRSQ
jgi:AcrR family transcriptional regulator